MKLIHDKNYILTQDEINAVKITAKNHGCGDWAFYFNGVKQIETGFYRDRVRGVPKARAIWEYRDGTFEETGYCYWNDFKRATITQVQIHIALLAKTLGI